MTYILAIETATKVCSVALFKNAELLNFKEEDGSYAHAEKLAVFVQELMQSAGIDYSELHAVVVSKGPGSYTGLRIGVSFAKGLCYAQNIPLIAVNTLEGMTCGVLPQISQKNALLCPMIDARRMEVYTALFDQSLNELEPTATKVIDNNFFSSETLNRPIYVFGDGAEKSTSVLNHPNIHLLKEFQPSARYLGAIGMQKYQDNNFEELAYFEPYYLKEFLAGKPKKLV